jgi:hypothetical protein
VGLAVDHHGAHAADPFTTVGVEGHGLLTTHRELLVQDVEHLEKGGVLRDVPDLVGHETALLLGPALAPDVQHEVHVL